MGGGNYITPGSPGDKKGDAVLIFSVPEKIGALAGVLAVFQVLKVNLRGVAFVTILL